MTTPLWFPFKDERSRSYGVRRIIGSNARYKRIWATRNPPLDQGQEGACTAFAASSRLAAAPDKWKVDGEFAEKLYTKTVEIDVAEGRNFGGAGATLLAGMKAGVEFGYYTSYYWAFGIDDVIDCIVRQGPILLGIPWYESMSNPDSDGFIPVDAKGQSSGHCIMANGYWPRHPDFGDVIVLTNTWGSDWGLRGRGYIHVSALSRLLSIDGEAVKPHDVAIEPPSVTPVGGIGADHLFDSE